MMTDYRLTTAMEDMLADTFVEGGEALKGATFKALERRGLAEECNLSSSASGRRLTTTGRREALRIGQERAADAQRAEDAAVAAAERDAERGPGCDAACGCGDPDPVATQPTDPIGEALRGMYREFEPPQLGFLADQGVEILPNGFNIAAARRLRAKLNDAPEQHDQGVWGRLDTAAGDSECGTTACAAGWTVLLERPDIADAFYIAVPTCDCGDCVDATTVRLENVVARMSPGYGVGGLAVSILGISHIEDAADLLFYNADDTFAVITLLDHLIATGGKTDWQSMVNALADAHQAAGR
jgi:hypothetical protein